MAIESNMSPTIEVEEQVGASENNKVTEKCLIFEKLLKENDSQELVKKINKATHEVKKVTHQSREQGCQGGLREPHAGDLQPQEQGLGQGSQEGAGTWPWPSSRPCPREGTKSTSTTRASQQQSSAIYIGAGS